MNFLIKKRLLNAGNPKGFWGIFTLKNMNNDHAKLVDAGLPYAQIQRNDVCLDIGCGGGYTLKRLSEQTDNKIYGIDISETSVKLSGKFNKKLSLEMISLSLLLLSLNREVRRLFLFRMKLLT